MREKVPTKYEVEAANRIIYGDGPTREEIKNARKGKFPVLIGLYILRGIEGAGLALRGLPSKYSAVDGYIERAKHYYEHPQERIIENAATTLKYSQKFGIKRIK